MKWDNIYVGGTGQFLPPKKVLTDLQSEEGLSSEAMQEADYASYTEALGISTTTMAARAAQQALNESGHKSDEISILIHAILDDPDHLTPVCHLQRVLDAPTALAFELGAASNGSAVALEVAANMITGDESAAVALVTAAGRYPSPTWRRWHAGMLVGDGAAAAILSRQAGVARLIAGSHGSLPDLETLSMVRHTNSTEPIPDISPYLSFMQEESTRIVGQVLDEAETKLQDIAAFAIPGVGRQGLSALYLEPMGISIEQTTWPFLREIGHVGPCDSLLGLDYLLRWRRPSPGEKILVIGLGMGVRITCILLEVTGSEPDPSGPKSLGDFASGAT